MLPTAFVQIRIADPFRVPTAGRRNPSAPDTFAWSTVSTEVEDIQDAIADVVVVGRRQELGGICVCPGRCHGGRGGGGRRRHASSKSEYRNSTNEIRLVGADG